MTAEQRAYERYWKSKNMDQKKKFDTWLARSDIWGEPGYEQPSVHYDWLAFKAGAEWARKHS